MILDVYRIPDLKKMGVVTVQIAMDLFTGVDKAWVFSIFRRPVLNGCSVFEGVG